MANGFNSLQSQGHHQSNQILSNTTNFNTMNGMKLKFDKQATHASLMQGKGQTQNLTGQLGPLTTVGNNHGDRATGGSQSFMDGGNGRYKKKSSGQMNMNPIMAQGVNPGPNSGTNKSHQMAVSQKQLQSHGGQNIPQQRILDNALNELNRQALGGVGKSTQLREVRNSSHNQKQSKSQNKMSAHSSRNQVNTMHAMKSSYQSQK